MMIKKKNEQIHISCIFVRGGEREIPECTHSEQRTEVLKSEKSIAFTVYTQ